MSADSAAAGLATFPLLALLVLRALDFIADLLGRAWGGALRVAWGWGAGRPVSVTAEQTGQKVVAGSSHPNTSPRPRPCHCGTATALTLAWRRGHQSAFAEKEVRGVAVRA
jgi:hypothetical protein